MLRDVVAVVVLVVVLGGAVLGNDARIFRVDAFGTTSPSIGCLVTMAAFRIRR